MIRSRASVRALRGLAAVVVAALIPAVAGCEAGWNAPTQQWHSSTAGASALVNHQIRINNMFVLGGFPAFPLPSGRSAGVFLALINSRFPDRLVAMAAPGTAAAVELPVGGVRLGSQQTVLLTGPTPQIVLRDLLHPLVGGRSVKIVLYFQRAGSVILQVPVMPRSQYYATFSPVPVIPSVTASPSAPATGHPTATPTAVPSSATPSASPTA